MYIAEETKREVATLRQVVLPLFERWDAIEPAALGLRSRVPAEEANGLQRLAGRIRDGPSRPRETTLLLVTLPPKGHSANRKEEPRIFDLETSNEVGHNAVLGGAAKINVAVEILRGIV